MSSPSESTSGQSGDEPSGQVARIREGLAQLDSKVTKGSGIEDYRETLRLIDEIRHLRTPPPKVDVGAEDCAPARLAYAIDNSVPQHVIWPHLAPRKDSLSWWLELYSRDSSRPQEARWNVVAWLAELRGDAQVISVPESPEGSDLAAQSGQETSSRFGRFIVGPIGFAAVVGVMVGINNWLLQDPVGQLFGEWLTWGALGILLIAVGAIVLLVVGLLLFVGLVILYDRYVAAKENRLLGARDVPSLRAALAGDKPELRRAALRAFGKAAASRQVEVQEIASYLSDDDERLAMVAVDTLRGLREQARPAVPALVDAFGLSKHQSFQFRGAVLTAIKKIGHNCAEEEQLAILAETIGEKDGVDRMNMNDILAQPPYDLAERREAESRHPALAGRFAELDAVLLNGSGESEYAESIRILGEIENDQAGVLIYAGLRPMSEMPKYCLDDSTPAAFAFLFNGGLYEAGDAAATDFVRQDGVRWWLQCFARDASRPEELRDLAVEYLASTSPGKGRRGTAAAPPLPPNIPVQS